MKVSVSTFSVSNPPTSDSLNAPAFLAPYLHSRGNAIEAFHPARAEQVSASK